MSVVGIWPTGEPNLWCVVGELEWKTEDGETIIIEDGFITDLASIPFWLQWLVNPFDPLTAPASVLHDWMLDKKMDQKKAAKEFYRRLLFDKFPRWKAMLYYAAVYVFIRTK
ncbi:MAG: DUF1353 domain-containing protein [Acinetobacter sp.]|uniref:DUF1353 domain-containing protein n=1 Tax=Acinetobacter sp. TaxID=472 RepID=UPI000FA6B2D5|nr:DUF1353 domain-containing protein [Acinetobacter sp.]RUP39335.1 MAG: DUF1353 domain-containing protein [Acinetobacter sp.]